MKLYYKLELQGQSLTTQFILTFSVSQSWNGHKDHVCMMMLTNRNRDSHEDVRLTFIFKVNHPCQVNDFFRPSTAEMLQSAPRSSLYYYVYIQPVLNKVIQ